MARWGSTPGTGDPTEHQSVFPDGHQDWRLGVTCDECSEKVAAKRKGTSGSRGLLQYGLQRMRATDYMSASEQEKQVLASARAKGIEPERYDPDGRYKN